MRTTATLALAVLLTVLVPLKAPGQLQPSAPAGDSVVAAVADAMDLPFVPPDQRPIFGTFWEIRASYPCIVVPLPCPPLDSALPVYAIGDPLLGGQFLVDETGGQILSASAQYPRRLSAGATLANIAEAQAAELQQFVSQIQEGQARRQAAAQMSAEGVPWPGDEDPGGTNEWGGGIAFGPPVYTTNDLWLQMISMIISNSTANLQIHPPANVTNGVYDLFSTTNLVPAWWDWVLRTSPGQTNITLTNMPLPMEFFILGITNDTDGGGLSDAYEGLLGLNTVDATDDYTNPIVSITVLDSVAVEQQSTNTATFQVSRRGGHMRWPLVLPLALSGTAVRAVNYTLSPVIVTSTNVLVEIPTNSTSVIVTLAPLDDHTNNGTTTATLTIQPGSGWSVDSARSSATAWILEEYSYTYTTVAHFNRGVLDGLEAVSTNDDGHLQFKTNLPSQFPFINVACSDRGTVARINTTNAAILGEYRTAPFGLPIAPSPSRTTVDQYGNVWVANREDTLAIGGTNYGSITRIGLVIGGSRFDKLGSNYVSNPNGHYVAISNATYNTCVDRDGDGFIRTSSGLADILPWNNSGGADSQGGVSTADDEAITEYVRVPFTGTRTIAVDRFNDIWVGGRNANQTHVKVNGLLGLLVSNSLFDAYAGGYGGVIDASGNLWSAAWPDPGTSDLLWLVPPSATNLPPRQGIDWQALAGSGYGIALDPLHPYIWQTSGGNVFRWHTNGTPETNALGAVKLYPHGATTSQGLAVDPNGHVWVAHAKETSSTVGHVWTNGTLIGVVSLYNYGLWAEYYDNTNLTGLPLTNKFEQSSIDYTNAWPEPPVPTNGFSARWTGTVTPLLQGQHVFYVEADAGAAFRLRVNGAVIIDNWTNPAPGQVELAGTNWLGTNIAYDIRLEYVHLTNAPLLKLSWEQPGSLKEFIPSDRFFNYSSGATGISIDPAGRIWAGCYDSSTAARIDPNSGPIVLTTNVLAGTANIITNHVGLVDMVVSLGDGTWHTSPYNVAAHPYNYSDMTGFNMRVVNPSLQPLKGYWIVVHDSGNAAQLWNKVSWTDSLTNGCSTEVYVRASDDRNGLGSEIFIAVTNNAYFSAIRGRYIEVRLAMARDDATKQPALYDLTLQGASSGFAGSLFLDDARAYETQDAIFYADLVGAQPMGYQWFRMYPWETNWVQVAGATNSTFAITNVDSWVDWTMASVVVTNGTGESLWLGPAFVEVWSLPNGIPASGSSGPASRYPATINVFGQPTNINTVAVSLWSLSHTRSADLSFLLLSPSGKRIILMSNVGGTNGVSGASLRFLNGWSDPPQSGAIPSGVTSTYRASNFGQKTPQVPFGLPAGAYSSNLADLQGDDPNGVWKLYIYDDVQPGGVGQLYNSWSLDFTFQ